MLQEKIDGYSRNVDGSYFLLVFVTILMVFEQVYYVSYLGTLAGCCGHFGVAGVNPLPLVLIPVFLLLRV